jgi:hypothetical protein
MSHHWASRVVVRCCWSPRSYVEFLLQDHLAHEPNLARCPKPRCQTPVIRDTHTQMVRCQNPGCGFTYCAACQVRVVCGCVACECVLCGAV